MAFASSSGKSVRTSGTVGGSGEISTHVTAIKAGSNVTLTSDADRVVTIASTGGGGGGGNTLDGAYDQGGSGAGRTITADNGAVKIVSGNNEALHVQVTADGIIPFKVEGDSNAISFGVSPENANSVLVCAGPIQSSQQLVASAGLGAKVVEPTAIDMQFSSQDVDQTAHGANSVLLGGSGNSISKPGTLPASQGQPTSVQAANAAIIGGGASLLVSVEGGQTCDGAGIFVGNRHSLTAEAGLGYSRDQDSEQSVIIGGAANTLLNSKNSGIFAGTRCNLKDNATSAVIAGLSNSITTPLGGSTSAEEGLHNVIIGGQGNGIEITTTNPRNNADNATLLGESNVIVGGKNNIINKEARHCVVVGTAGLASTSGGNNDDSVLFIGGSMGTPPGGDRSTNNAFMFPGISSRHSGASDAGKGYADDSFNGGGADYAEMFEWNDGNPNDEDRVGLFVKISSDGNLPNGKIEVGGNGMIIGPVSSRPGMVVNNPGMRWNSKFVLDDFGRFVLDADGNKQLNPNYDDTLDYQGRTGRKEWSPIALKGRVRVKASSNIGIYPSNKSGLTVNVNADGTVSDAGSKGKYKVLQVVRQKEVWSGPQGLFRSRTLVQDHGYGVVEILVE